MFAEDVGDFTGWFSTKSIGVSVLTVIAFTSALSVISNLILHAHFSSVFKNGINGSNTIESISLVLFEFIFPLIEKPLRHFLIAFGFVKLLRSCICHCRLNQNPFGLRLFTKCFDLTK